MREILLKKMKPIRQTSSASVAGVATVVSGGIAVAVTTGLAAVAALLWVAVVLPPHKRQWEDDDDDDDEPPAHFQRNHDDDDDRNGNHDGDAAVPPEALEKTSTTATPSRSVQSRTAQQQAPPQQQQQRHIRQQQGRIRDILRYWFGQYKTAAEAQKKLWMIPVDQTQRRQAVDLDIWQKFGYLLLPAAPPPPPPQKSTPSNTNNARTAAVQPPSEPLWEEWCTDAELYGLNGKIAAIILLDQFSRHVHRCLVEQQSILIQQSKEEAEIITTAIPLQSTLDQAALRVAQAVQDDHPADWPLLTSQAMKIFSTLPFRHANQLETVQFVQAQIAQWTQDLLVDQTDLLNRYRKATHRRLAVLQDEARRNGGGKNNSNNNNANTAAFTHEDILEAFPFVPENMEPATQHVVYQTIVKFLVARGIPQTTSSSSNRNSTDAKKVPLIVSLSGGVDSMVIAAVLRHLAQSGTFLIHVVAVHIDYANRPESAAEAAFCRDWCSVQQLNGDMIDFYVRRIDEVTRGITARDAYEKISRQVRYSFYRDTVAKYASSPDFAASRSGHGIGVVLGHHRGDLRENVLSNAHKGSGPLDLSGMTAVSQNDGVTLHRPLLPLEKTFIFDYAHKFGVPYFKDTTPHWSTRGKLRNRLLPLLEEIYGEGCLSNLSNLAVESDECRALLQSVLFGPFMDKIQRKPMGLVFETAPWKDQGLFFWKFVLREALHSAGMGMFSDKAVTAFLERVHAGKGGWLQCRKDYAVFLQGSGDVFVWKPESFPWHKKDQYQIAGQTVGYGHDNSARVGPWRVTALLDEGNGERESLLRKKAVESMIQLMEGSLEYYIEAPTWQQRTTNGSVSFQPRPLVFRQFTKHSRPIAWKNFDARIQDTLPLLRNDDDALAALEDPVACGAVRVEEESGLTVPNPTVLVKITVCLADTTN